MVGENSGVGEFSTALSSEEADLILRSNKKVKKGWPYSSPPNALPWKEGASFADTIKGIGRVLLDDEEGFVVEDLHWTSQNTRKVIFRESESKAKDSKAENEDFPTFLEGNPRCPKVRISRKEKRWLRTPWKQAIIIKLLGKRITYGFLVRKLQSLWSPLGGMDIIDIGNDFYIVGFVSKEDYQ